MVDDITIPIVTPVDKIKEFLKKVAKVIPPNPFHPFRYYSILCSLCISKGF